MTRQACSPDWKSTWWPERSIKGSHIFIQDWGPGWARVRLEDKRKEGRRAGRSPSELCELQVWDVPVETQGNPEPGDREASLYLPWALRI